MILYGIDPGKTTGVVIVELNDYGVENVEHMQLEGFEHTIDEILKSLSCHALWPDAPATDNFNMIIESWINLQTPFYADANWACQVIGALRWELWNRYGLAPIMQSPQTRLFITDDVLRKLGYWIVGQEHAQQAMKHVLTYCIRVLHHPALMRELRDVTELA